MIEMSVDKETVLPKERPGGGALPPPAQQPTECSENSPKPVPVKTGDEEDKTDENKTDVDVYHQPELSQNGVQHPKSQQKLGKRRSTMSSGFKHPIFGKRRRRANSESSRESVLPTNFLLGGNIFDPLNLNSLLDEEVNRALNAETPKSSPLPAKSRDPVEILIPRDITDPLNLNCSSTGDTGPRLTPLKSSGRRRHRNRHHGGVSGGGGASGTGTGASGGGGGPGGAAVIHLDFSEPEKTQTCPASQTETPVTSSAPAPDSSAPTQEPKTFPTQENQSSTSEEKDERPAPETSTPATHRQRKHRKRTTSKSESWDKTKAKAAGSCSGAGKQVQPNPPAQQQHPNHRKHQKNQPKLNQNQQKKNNNNQQQQQQHHQKKKKFQFGNYDKYYGYRTPGLTEDPRLRTLKPEWFTGKEVLDLGCNTGRVTLSIARNWRPSRIVGLDIDGALIHAARQNIRHYLSEIHILKSRSSGRVEQEEERDGENREERMEEESAERERSTSEVEQSNKTKIISSKEEKSDETENGTAKEEEKMDERENDRAKQEEKMDETENDRAKENEKVEEESAERERSEGEVEQSNKTKIISSKEEKTDRTELKEKRDETESDRAKKEEKMGEESAEKSESEVEQTNKTKVSSKEEKRNEMKNDKTKEEEKMEEESAERSESKVEQKNKTKIISSKEEKRNETDNDKTKEEEKMEGQEVTKEMEGKMDSSANGHHLFPVSFRISRGPIAAPPLPDTHTPSPGHFPSNITFIKGNYVLDSDWLLLSQREEFDVVLCLSVSKWVQLNWGDEGLKRFFHRVYRHLRPGGIFILEPQPWHSYSKRKKLTETITKNYYSIRLKPEQFSSYLTEEVGFSSYELIGTPNNSSRGFQRPIYLFHKGPAPRK